MYAFSNCGHGRLTIVVERNVVSILAAVDAAWAGFEHGYISELMSIGDKARNLLVKAIRVEEELSAAEGLRQQMPGCEQISDAQRHFVKCIAKLNSIANTQGKGRDGSASPSHCGCSIGSRSRQIFHCNRSKILGK